MNGKKKALATLVALSFTSTTITAYADPDPKTAADGTKLETWTSSDRFALIGVLVIGLGCGAGGLAAYSEAETKEEKADEFEKSIQKTSGKARPCPGESGCDELERQREDAARSERGGIVGMVIGGIFLGGLLPVVIYTGFQPKKPSTPNLMMKIAPVVSPNQAGLIVTGRF